MLKVKNTSPAKAQFGFLQASCALIAGIVFAQPAIGKGNDPLFETHELLEVKLQAPLKTLNKKRDLSVSYPASLSYPGDAGLVNLQIEVKVRGKNRRKRGVCKFPPLRLVFNKKHVKGTLFENQKTLKLVTQCDPYSTIYQGYLLSEYLAYRILNQITPSSFDVRLIRITYADTESAKSLTNFEFFIEHKKRLAKRLGAKHQEIEQTSAVDLDSAHLNQVSLFQLLIGNVDWSATSGSSEECCHNSKIFQQGDKLLSIPYDFDLSGLVNATYARPDIEMGLKTIRDRRYRGYCRNNGFLEENIELFNSKKETILDFFRTSPHLRPRKKKSSISYIESFYRIINDPKRIARATKKCHKSYLIEVTDAPD